MLTYLEYGCYGRGANSDCTSPSDDVEYVDWYDYVPTHEDLAISTVRAPAVRLHHHALQESMHTKIILRCNAQNGACAPLLCSDAMSA